MNAKVRANLAFNAWYVVEGDLMRNPTPLVSRLPTQRTGTTQGTKHVHITMGKTTDCALKRKSTTPKVLQTLCKYTQTILNQ